MLVSQGGCLNAGEEGMNLVSWVSLFCSTAVKEEGRLYRASTYWLVT